MCVVDRVERRVERSGDSCDIEWGIEGKGGKEEAIRSCARPNFVACCQTGGHAIRPVDAIGKGESDC